MTASGDETRSALDADGRRDPAGEPRPVDDPAGGLPLFDRRLRIESLAEKLNGLADDLEQRSIAAHTRRDAADGVLLPLLRHLGWDVADNTAVTPGFKTPAGTVDFALCHPPGDPLILIRIGALPGPGAAPGDHPFDDFSIQAIQLAVSEDGRGWRFHFPARRGSIRNREFARFDIVADPKEAIAETLDSYMSFHAAKSGENFREAAWDYGRKRFPAEAYRAWRRTVAGREVWRRFLREMEETIGIPANRRRAMWICPRPAQLGSLAAGPPGSETRPPGRGGRQGVGLRLRVARDHHPSRGGSRAGLGKGGGLARLRHRPCAARSPRGRGEGGRPAGRRRHAHSNRSDSELREAEVIHT